MIRNVYKVLLTRGMMGTLIYSTDEETRAFLSEMVGAQGIDRGKPAAAPARLPSDASELG